MTPVPFGLVARVEALWVQCGERALRVAGGEARVRGVARPHELRKEPEGPDEADRGETEEVRAGRWHVLIVLRRGREHHPSPHVCFIRDYRRCGGCFRWVGDSSVRVTGDEQKAP